MDIDEGSESIQIWKGTSAPQAYRKYFPWASDCEWIALVPAGLCVEFTNFVLLDRPLSGGSILWHPLDDGQTAFCGPLGSSDPSPI